MFTTTKLAAYVAAAVFITGGLAPAARGEEKNPAALAAAMQAAKTTLEAGLAASGRDGKPISAKFEIEDGKLQLSVYTAKDRDFREAVLDPVTGAITKAEKITDAGDLKEAKEQTAAMTKATRTLLVATEATVKANAGSRAVSVVPEMKSGHPVAEVTLLQGSAFKKVEAKLD
jgi:hypothetical protein